MLVLSRKVGERIRIGENVTLVISRIAGNRVTLGIEAPNGVRILRGELEPIADSFKQHTADAYSHEEEHTVPAPVSAPLGLALDFNQDVTTYIPRAAR